MEKIAFFLRYLPGKSQINSDSISQAYFVLSWHLQQEFKAQSFRVVKGTEHGAVAQPGD